VLKQKIMTPEKIGMRKIKMQMFSNPHVLIRCWLPFTEEKKSQGNIIRE